MATSKFESEFDDSDDYDNDCYLREKAQTDPLTLSTLPPNNFAGSGLYYIGTAYDQKEYIAKQWALPNPGPYLTYVKESAKVLPQLRYLADWMEVSCDPTKWEYLYPARWENHSKAKDLLPKLKEIREERAGRTKLCMIDYEHNTARAPVEFNEIQGLRSWLKEPGNSSQKVQARLFVVEDLSREVVETLGSHFQIEPCFFRSHLCDYLWYNTRDKWFELPKLPSGNQKADHFSMQYARPWYFDSLSALNTARFAAGSFNVLRRFARDKNRKEGLDDHDAIVATIRSKVSMWTRKNKANEEGLVSILLVDPTVPGGRPLWGGRRNHVRCPEFGVPANPADAVPDGHSLFKEVVYAAKHLSSEEIEHITTTHDRKGLGLSIYRILLAEWLTLLKYIGARLGQIDWELEKPEFQPKKGGLDESLQKLHFWRRHVPQYRGMLIESIDALFGRSATSATILPTSAIPGLTTDDDVGTNSVLQDFLSVLEQMERVEARIDKIVAVATTSISIQESRQAMDQNTKLAKLTGLATVFVPLSFLASFFSMTNDVASLRKTYWIFFIIAFPLTLIALVLVNFFNVQDRIKKMLRWPWRSKQ